LYFLHKSSLDFARFMYALIVVIVSDCELAFTIQGVFLTEYKWGMSKLFTPHVQMISKMPVTLERYRPKSPVPVGEAPFSHSQSDPRSPHREVAFLLFQESVQAVFQC